MKFGARQRAGSGRICRPEAREATRLLYEATQALCAGADLLPEAYQELAWSAEVSRPLSSTAATMAGKSVARHGPLLLRGGLHERHGSGQVRAEGRIESVALHDVLRRVVG